MLVTNIFSFTGYSTLPHTIVIMSATFTFHMKMSPILTSLKFPPWSKNLQTYVTETQFMGEKLLQEGRETLWYQYQLAGR